jgi:chromosome partitioning protein
MIVTLVSQKGGVGKSSLAAAIGWELHSRGARTLLVDADPQGTVRITSEVAEERGLEAPTVIAMGKDMARKDQLPKLARGYDMVIIDTPGRSGEVQRASMMVARLAVIPIGQSAADAWGTTDTLSAIAEVQTVRPQLQAAMCITKKCPRTTLGRNARDVLSAQGTPVLVAETTHRVAWQECLAAGMGVAQYAPSDASADEARAVVDEILALSLSLTEARVA